jgi:LDH2 family malate/lactate/ureidoglycolate dehydrogenase
LKNVPPEHGVEEIFYPREIKARNDVRHRADGLVLVEGTLEDLMPIANEMGVRADF